MTAATYQNQLLPLPARGAAPIAVASEETSQFQRLGFNVLVVFLFLIFSRIFDVKFGSLHITGIAYRVVLAMVLLSRGFLVALKTNIGKAMLGLTVWMVLSVPFSIWRTGSKDLVQHQWLEFSFIAFLSVAGLVNNYQQWFKLFKTLTYALLVFTVIANVFGGSDNGRLFLQQGKFANPNEMAQALLLGLPLWGVMMANTKSPISKVFAAGVMMLILATTFRTGSRGAMIAFLTMMLIVFLREPMLGKLKIIFAGVLLLGMIMTTMPGKLISRYKTVAEEDVTDIGDMDAAMATSASTSTQSRKELLRHSLIFTIRHPLFGVGPGMFVVADDAYMKSLGFRQGSWLGTHNSYTQISSELGIPGFLFFVTAVGMALKGTYTLYRRTRGDPRLEELGNVTLGFHYCMVIYAVTILFEHIAYSIMLPVFGGMAACLIQTAQAEIQRIQSTPLPVSMSPAMFHTYLAKRPKLGQAV
jgi:O-antigen ligase